MPEEDKGFRKIKQTIQNQIGAYVLTLDEGQQLVQIIRSRMRSRDVMDAWDALYEAREKEKNG